jgi:hypothetical protein
VTCRLGLSTWAAPPLVLPFARILRWLRFTFSLTPLGRYYLPHYLGREQRQVSRNGQVSSFFSFTARPSRFGWPCRKTHKKGVEGRVMRGRLPSRYRPVPSPMAINLDPEPYVWLCKSAAASVLMAPHLW